MLILGRCGAPERESDWVMVASAFGNGTLFYCILTFTFIYPGIFLHTFLRTTFLCTLPIHFLYLNDFRRTDKPQTKLHCKFPASTDTRPIGTHLPSDERHFQLFNGHILRHSADTQMAMTKRYVGLQLVAINFPIIAKAP